MAASIKLSRQVYRDALERAQLTPEEISEVESQIGDGARTTNVSVRIGDLPTNYLACLLNEAGLDPTQRAIISMRVHGVKGDRSEYERIYDTVVASEVEFASTFAALGVHSPNCEYFINGRWYPIALGVHYRESESKLFRSVDLQGALSIGDFQESIHINVPSHLFKEELGGAVERSVREVLGRLSLRPLRSKTSEYNLRLLNAERLGRESGKSVWVSGPVLLLNRYSWWGRTESRSLGSKTAPRRAVIEPDLETNENDRAYYGTTTEQHVSRLPFVRVFSLDTKRYVYADVDDLDEYEYDSTAIDRLHLPEGMLSILTKVFTAPTESVFGDLIAGKHGGIVVLASGKPGVGKTLTAEVYSEITERPLYVLELGELGTTAGEVEENLNRVFTRVARWNAVLQFDECEIFLAERGNDLERSAIVGIFLRLLDYYRGILFLTTNRADVLDNAVLSRVTLRLDYPDLDAATRRDIWRTMLSLAEVNAPDDATEGLSRLPLNGRQIRNLVRLTKVVHASEPVDEELISQLVRVAVPDLVENTDV